MDIVIYQFNGALGHFFECWPLLSLPVFLMVVGIFRRVTSPMPSRKPKFGRD